MAEFINTVDVLGDETVTNSIIDKSIAEYKDNNITSIGASAFYKCSNLSTVDFPAVTSIGKNAFQLCSALTSINLPVVTSIGDTAFGACSKLTRVDFPMVTSISSNAFVACSKLTALILRSTTMCNLSSAGAFNNTPMFSGGGYIYVPRALLSDEDETKDYRMATNWSYLSTQFRALEDYTVDGTITGELDSNKI